MATCGPEAARSFTRGSDRRCPFLHEQNIRKYKCTSAMRLQHRSKTSTTSIPFLRYCKRECSRTELVLQSRSFGNLNAHTRRVVASFRLAQARYLFQTMLIIFRAFRTTSIRRETLILSSQKSARFPCCSIISSDFRFSYYQMTSHVKNIVDVGLLIRLAGCPSVGSADSWSKPISILVPSVVQLIRLIFSRPVFLGAIWKSPDTSTACPSW